MEHLHQGSVGECVCFLTGFFDFLGIGGSLSPSGDGCLADLFLGRPRSRRYPKFNIRRDIPVDCGQAGCLPSRLDDGLPVNGKVTLNGRHQSSSFSSGMRTNSGYASIPSSAAS